MKTVINHGHFELNEHEQMDAEGILIVEISPRSTTWSGKNTLIGIVDVKKTVKPIDR